MSVVDGPERIERNKQDLRERERNAGAFLPGAPEAPPRDTETGEARPSHAWRAWLFVLLDVYLILLAVGLIGAGFKLATGGSEGAAKLLSFATDPCLGLLVGLLATALVQSSSTVTSVIVGLCAGGLPVAAAIPMVMGANVGTTVTNTLVSLAHLRERSEFRRAFAAATVHDFFNLFCVALFFPIELKFGLLEKLSAAMAGWLTGLGSGPSVEHLDPVGAVTRPVIQSIRGAAAGLPDGAAGALLVAAGGVTIFAAILKLGKLLKVLMVGRVQRVLLGGERRGALSGLVRGTLVTVLVQSSSTTTSLMIPLAGSGVWSLRDVYPFTLGANIGTCVTALMAAAAVTGSDAHLALQIALVHLSFNVLGVLVIYGLWFLRELPMLAAERLALAAERNAAVAIGYVLAVFFLIPGAFLAFTPRTAAETVPAVGLSTAGGLPGEGVAPLPARNPLAIPTAIR